MSWDSAQRSGVGSSRSHLSRAEVALAAASTGRSTCPLGGLPRRWAGTRGATAAMGLHTESRGRAGWVGVRAMRNGNHSKLPRASADDFKAFRAYMLGRFMWSMRTAKSWAGPHCRPTLNAPSGPCRAAPCRAVPCRAVPCRAVPCRAFASLTAHRFPPPLPTVDKTKVTEKSFAFCMIIGQGGFGKVHAAHIVKVRLRLWRMRVRMGMGMGMSRTPSAPHRAVLHDGRARRCLPAGLTVRSCVAALQSGSREP